MKIRITPTNRKDAKDKKTAKLLEDFINHEHKRYEGILNAVVAARFYLKAAYGLETPDKIWERILEEVVKYDVSLLEEKKVPRRVLFR